MTVPRTERRVRPTFRGAASVVLAFLLPVLAPTMTRSAVAEPIRVRLDGDAAAPKAAARADDRLFAPLAETPANVDLWVRLVDGGAWIHDPTVRPLLDALAASLVGATGGGALGGSQGAVAEFAARLGLTATEACERYLGRDARFVLRGQGDARGGAGDWCLVSRVAPPDVERLLRGLRAVVRGGGLYTVPEEQLAIRLQGEWIVIGRSSESALFSECAERLLASPAPSLLEALVGAGLRREDLGSLEPRALEKSEGGAGGRMAIAFKGPSPLAGWSVIAIEARAGQLFGAMRGSYSHAPLPPAKPMKLDLSLLDTFDGLCLGAQIDPIAAELDPGDAFFVRRFPALLRSAAARANLGATRLLLVGEVDGGNAKPPLAMRCPAVALAYEVDDPELARQDQDRMMISLVDHERRSRTPEADAEAQAPTPPKTPPVLLPEDPAAPRHYDVRSLLAEALGDPLLGEHPLLRSLSLNWQTVRCGGRSWQVFATHPEWLAAVTRGLGATKVGDAAAMPSITSAGLLCGPRVASHVRSWAGEAKAFESGAPAEFARGVELIASIAERFQTLRWELSQPTERSLAVSLRASLAPATSPIVAPTKPAGSRR